MNGEQTIIIAVTPLPRNSPLLIKYYFHTLTPDSPLPKFKRYAYILWYDESLILVHYIDDHSVAEDYLHGNSKQDAHNFFCTVPSYLKSLEEKVAIDRTNKVYKKEIAASTSNQYVPRNVQQVRNLCFKAMCIQLVMMLEDKNIPRFSDCMWNKQDV